MKLLFLTCFFLSIAFCLNFEEEKKLERLVCWIKKNGGYVSEKLSMGVFEGYGRGVMAKEEIPEGEVLLRIPSKRKKQRHFVFCCV